MFQLKAEERRKFFRVRPSDDEPILVQVADKTIHARDISAGGISFENQNLMEGKNLSIHITLPDGAAINSVTIRIVAIDDNDICHAKFLKMAPSETEKIHQYALKRQVEIAKKEKKEKKQNWHID